MSDDERRARSAYNKRYYEFHTDQIIARARAWKDAHPDEVRKRQPAYARRWRAQNVDVARAADAQWRARPDSKARKRIYDAQRHAVASKKHAAQTRAWRQANPERAADQYARRRARKRRSPIIVKVDRYAIYARDGGRCHICGKRVRKERFDLDHLVPLAKGGEHAPFNLAVAHPRCNARKAASRIPVQVPLPW